TIYPTNLSDQSIRPIYAIYACDHVCGCDATGLQGELLNMPHAATNGGEPNGQVQDPGAEYLSRRSDRQAVLDSLARRDLQVSNARTAIALVAALLAALAFGFHTISGWWLAVPAALFVVLMSVHERVLQSKSRAERAVEFYDAGLRRLEGRWTGRGVIASDFT